MPRAAAVVAAVLSACVWHAVPARGQDNSSIEARPAPSLTAERLLEVAREAYRPSGLPGGCDAGKAGEIVVCASASDRVQRVSSPTDDAIAAGVAVRDRVLRAPELAPPPCDPRSRGCFKFGAPPPMPPMIDFSAIPEPLTPEEAALVFRVEDAPSSAAASPAEAR